MGLSKVKPRSISRSILIDEIEYRDLLRVEKVMQAMAFKVDIPVMSESEMEAIESLVTSEIVARRLNRK